jgi:hypothetical protein
MLPTAALRPDVAAREDVIELRGNTPFESPRMSAVAVGYLTEIRLQKN